MNVAVVFEQKEAYVIKTLVCCEEMPEQDVEFLHNVMDKVLDSAFMFGETIGEFMKKIIVNLCFASVRTYNDLLLAYYLEHNYDGLTVLEISEKKLDISKGNVINFTYWKAILDILERANSMTPKVCADIYQIASRGDLQGLCDSIKNDKLSLKKKLKYVLEEGRNEE